MKISLIRQVIRWELPVISAGLLWACNGDRQAAETTARAFLQAYYTDLDFNKVKSLCSNASHSAINDQAEMIALNPYSKEETPNIVMKWVKIESNNSNVATCVYNCNHIERTLPLRKFNGQWLVDLSNGSVETNGNHDFMQLSQDGINGFTSATSGDIKYKKRRQGNN